MIVPRWCAECSHHHPKDPASSLCGLRKCTMKPDFHREGTDDSATIAKDCGAIQGFRGKRVLDVLGEVHERDARAAELAAMQKPKRKRANNPAPVAPISPTNPGSYVKTRIPRVGEDEKAAVVETNRTENPPAIDQVARPTADQVAKAKACQHLRQEEFIDASFTGIGIACLDCHLLMRWVKKPDWVEAGAPAPPDPFKPGKPRVKPLEAWK